MKRFTFRGAFRFKNMRVPLLQAIGTININILRIVLCIVV